MTASGSGGVAARRPLAQPQASATRHRASVVAVGIEDGGLAARFAAGDPDTIRVIYQNYGRLVHATAYKVLGDSALAEDATQQTFVQAWRAAGSYDPSRALGAWLGSIARRVAIDVYRHERRHRGIEAIDSSNPALVSMPPSIEQLYDVWQVRQALQRLPDQDRELIRLQHYGQLTHTEIASELEIPLGTVKSRSFRAHKRLAGLLGHLRREPGKSEPTNDPSSPKPGDGEKGPVP